MNTLLVVQASLLGSAGQSSQLAEGFVASWLKQNPNGHVVTRDLSAGIPHLTAERFQSFATQPAKRTPEQQAIVEFSDTLIAELQGADTIVFAVPMYNFSVPSTLRAYFDHIARSGVTFRYTASGPEGLIKGKQTYVFISRGGIYDASADTQTPYLKQFLAFLGLIDVQFIYAEGLSMGEEIREKNLAAARHSIAQLVPFTQIAA